MRSCGRRGEGGAGDWSVTGLGNGIRQQPWPNISSVYGKSSPPSSSLSTREDESDGSKRSVHKTFLRLGYPVSEKDVEFFWVGGIPIG
jgi:hypothetical protein